MRSLMVISRLMGRYYSARGVRTLRVPPLFDPAADARADAVSLDADRMPVTIAGTEPGHGDARHPSRSGSHGSPEVVASAAESTRSVHVGSCRRLVSTFGVASATITTTRALDIGHAWSTWEVRSSPRRPGRNPSHSSAPPTCRHAR